MAKYEVTVFKKNEQLVEANSKKEAIEKRSLNAQKCYAIVNWTKVKKIKEK